MTQSLAQAQAARFNAAYARRNIGGSSAAVLREEEKKDKEKDAKSGAK